MCHIKEKRKISAIGLLKIQIYTHADTQEKRVVCLFLYIAQKPIVTINLFLICFKVKKRTKKKFICTHKCEKCSFTTTEYLLVIFLK